MAYVFDKIFKNLYLYPSRRKQKRENQNIWECHDRLFDKRDMAWGKLDLPLMGNASWIVLLSKPDI